MTRIAVNATTLGKHPTGLGVYTREVVKRLVAEGWLDGSSIYTGDPQAFRGIRDSVTIIPWSSRHGGTQGHLARLCWLQTAFRRAVIQSGCGLIYSTVPEGTVCPPKGVAQIITVHDIIPVRFPALHQNLVWYYRMVVPRLLRSSAAVICNSTYTRDDLLKWSGLSRLDIYVVPEGFDTDTYSEISAGSETLPHGVEPPYFLWVGDMRPYKNLERVLEAFASMRAPGLSLVVAGKADARYYPGILETTERLGLAGSVHYLGYVSDAELACLYRHATSLIFASLYEGFGLPPLEAMASGCPVIASRTTSLPEVCGDAVLYVDPLSIQSIAGGMKEVASSSALQERLHVAGLQRAHLFSWERAARQIGEVLATASSAASQA
ncbi:glycosyltransferase family 4 protein [bacterium]|nr:glycosyltransferase family 4 protein [bacterium]